MGWFYKTKETEHGPVSEDDIIAKFRVSDLTEASMIKEDDSIAWRRIDQSEIGKKSSAFLTIPSPMRMIAC